MQGLRVEKRTRAKLKDAVRSTRWSMRAVMSAILDGWARGELWLVPRRQAVTVGGLAVVLALVGGWAGSNCAPARELAAPPPPVLQLEPVDLLPGGTFSAGLELEQRGAASARRGIPLKPGPNQKTPPCDAEMGEEAIRGACYARMARRPPLRPSPRARGRLLPGGRQAGGDAGQPRAGEARVGASRGILTV